MESSNCYIIILAAGASTRLGMAKQLLPCGNTNLLQHAIDTACASRASGVTLILGAHADEIQEEINADHVTVITNSSWEEGMASSLRCGVRHILGTQPLAERILFMVCDQPFVSTAMINEMIDASANNKIVAASYDFVTGVPALFDKSYFDRLDSLTGDRGARTLLARFAADVHPIYFPGGGTDIDTLQDFDRWKSRQVVASLCE